MVTCRPSPTAPARQSQAAVTDLPLFVCPFTILRDTREQAPWTFGGIVIEKRLWVVPQRVATLATADYSIEGCESILVERKSGADLVGSVTSGNARFRREHERMQAVVEAGGFAAVIVEASLSAICDELDADQGRRVTSASVRGAAVKWPRRYGVWWHFAGSRREAELDAFLLMLDWWNENGGPVT